MAGVVVEADPGSRFPPGTPVAFLSNSYRWDQRYGAYAELIAAPEAHVAALPEGVGFEEAAALPMAALTALQVGAMHSASRNPLRWANCWSAEARLHGGMRSKPRRQKAFTEQLRPPSSRPHHPTATHLPSHPPPPIPACRPLTRSTCSVGSGC